MMQNSSNKHALVTEFHWQDFCDEFFLANVLESIHDAVLVVNAEGTIVYINPAYERELNTKFHRVVGKKLLKFATDSMIMKVLNTGQAIIEQPHRIAAVGIDIVVSSTPIFKKDVLIGAVSIFKNVTEIKRMSEELAKMEHLADYLREQLDIKTVEGFKNIIGSNKGFRDMISRAIKASLSEVTVLILGETGTGKDLIAKAIHDSSKRKKGPFIEINCAAIPENLLESELFGFEDGAFTGARRGGKPGKFELAEGGTLFLDEIGDMSIVLQAKLLLFLQEKRFERVGGTKRIRSDVRIIAATNQDLEVRMKENQFRADLFYRLNVFSINITPLRKRSDDIPLLSTHFLKKFAEREGKSVQFSSLTLQAMMHYHWPGNVRELQNVIESAVVSCDKQYIEREDLPGYLMPFVLPSKHAVDSQTEDMMNLDEQVSLLERDRIVKALEKVKNNRSKAIKILGISRSSFYQKLSRYNIK